MILIRRTRRYYYYYYYNIRTRGRAGSFDDQERFLGREGGGGGGDVDGSNGEITISGWATMIRRDNKGNYALYQCGMCGKSYSWKSSYHRHLREECGKQQRAKCKNCGRQYRWRDSLNKHLKYECGVEPKYTCSVCGRKFRHKQVLTSHLRKFHWISRSKERDSSYFFFIAFNNLR